MTQNASIPPLFVSASAHISGDGLHRLSLTRVWDKSLPHIAWLMLNPSTADASVDDPTVRRCVGFSKRLGAGGLRIVNLFTMRTPYPEALWREAAMGVAALNHPEADAAIGAAVRGALMVIAAWGHAPEAEPRARAVVGLLGGVPLMCLGKTVNGWPRHPLRLPRTTEVVSWP